jgi:hypothetical protein
MSTSVAKNEIVTITATYLGSRAEVTTRHLTGGQFGIRVVSTRWIDAAHESNGGHPAGTTVVIVCRGDGRKDDFEVFATEVIPAVTS